MRSLGDPKLASLLRMRSVGFGALPTPYLGGYGKARDIKNYRAAVLFKAGADQAAAAP